MQQLPGKKADKMQMKELKKPRKNAEGTVEEYDHVKR